MKKLISFLTLICLTMFVVGCAENTSSSPAANPSGDIDDSASSNADTSTEDAAAADAAAAKAAEEEAAAKKAADDAAQPRLLR